MRKTAQGLKIGDEFMYNGHHYKISKFPTRSSAVLEMIEPSSGGIGTMKVPISDLLKYYTQIGPDNKSFSRGSEKKLSRGFLYKPEPWVKKLLEQHGTAVPIGSKTFYYLPFWWEIDSKIPNTISWYHMNVMPEQLKKYIAESRLEGNNLLSESGSSVDQPTRPEEVYKPEIKLQCPKCKMIYKASLMPTLDCYGLDLIEIKPGCCNIHDLKKVE